MRIRPLLLAASFALAFGQPRAAWAGMPSPVLTDWAALRFETLSFFIVLLLVCTLVMRSLWNYLAADFPAMPRLSYRKTLAATVLVGLLLAVVLTMIAGARELLTPGAWQKQGLLYKVAAPPSTEVPALPAIANQLEQRKERLKKLGDALQKYAAQHEGRFPPSGTSAGVAPAMWELPGVAGVRYLYVPGVQVNQSSHLLVYEPNVYGDDRLVLRANGEILILSTTELHNQLSRGKP